MWTYVRAQAWDEEEVPADIMQAQWMRTLRRVTVHENAEVNSKVVGSIPVGDTIYVLVSLSHRPQASP
jgi:hypothetical protein